MVIGCEMTEINGINEDNSHLNYPLEPILNQISRLVKCYDFCEVKCMTVFVIGCLFVCKYILNWREKKIESFKPKYFPNQVLDHF